MTLRRLLLPLGLAWLALLALLALSFGSAYLPLGPLNTVLNFGIAAIKVAIITWVFMEWRSTDHAMRLAIALPLLLLAILFALSFDDVLTRSAGEAGWQAPAR